MGMELEAYTYRITNKLLDCRQTFENNGIMALYCSRIGFDIQNFPIVPNRLDHCKIKTISRKLGLVAQCPQEQSRMIIMLNKGLTYSSR